MKSKHDAVVDGEPRHFAAQLDMLETDPNVHKSRVTDPETSKVAGARHTADRVRPTQARVLAGLRITGPVHDKALVEYVQAWEREMGMQHVQSESGIRSRRAELVRMSKIRFTGRWVELDGYRQRVWEVVP